MQAHVERVGFPQLNQIRQAQSQARKASKRLDPRCGAPRKRLHSSSEGMVGR
jgi:hypothetical protein